MGDEDKEVTEEDMDKANEKKREAITAFSEQEFDKAVQLYTEAILLNPGIQIFDLIYPLPIVFLFHPETHQQQQPYPDLFNFPFCQVLPYCMLSVDSAISSWANPTLA